MEPNVSMEETGTVLEASTIRTGAWLTACTLWSLWTTTTTREVMEEPEVSSQPPTTSRVTMTGSTRLEPPSCSPTTTASRESCPATILTTLIRVLLDLNLPPSPMRVVMDGLVNTDGAQS